MSGPFCVDCKFYRPACGYSYLTPQGCFHPNFPDLVSGGMQWLKPDVLRREGHPCGPSGVMFEQKPAPVVKPRSWWKKALGL